MVTLNIPVDRIRAEARQYDPVELLLKLLVLPFLAIGWTARAVWLLVSLGVAAVKVGWEMGPSGPSSPAARPRSGRGAP